MYTAIYIYIKQKTFPEIFPLFQQLRRNCQIRKNTNKKNEKKPKQIKNKKTKKPNKPTKTNANKNKNNENNKKARNKNKLHPKIYHTKQA